jgi:hypothetical protein
MRAFALLCVLLAGCALFPLQEKDCVGVNWEQRGYADGFSGQFQQYLRLAEECPRFGVTVSKEDYFRGWKEGHNEWDRLIGSMDKRR